MLFFHPAIFTDLADFDKIFKLLGLQSTMCSAGSHLTVKSWYTGETKSKPPSKSRGILKSLTAAVY
jgi:hypothetical protein